MTLRIALMLRHVDDQGGTGVYTKRMTEAMLRADAGNEYLLVFGSEDARNRHRGLLDRGNARALVVEAGSKLAWDQVAVPLALERVRVDVVFNLKHSVPLAPFAPRVFVVHGAEWLAFPQDYHPLDRLYHGLALPLYLGAADRIVTISHDSARRIAGYMPSVAGRLSVVHHGVGPGFRPVADPARLEAARRAFGLPDRFVLYVGQVYPHKNVGGILKALAYLRDRGLPHHLVIAGRPSLKAERDLALIARLGLGDRVTITGWLAHRDLPAIYSLADALVYPSLFEGFGIPLLEAMACGCPVVTSTAGACPEVVGDAGLLVDPTSPGSIAAAVERVVTDPALADELRRRGLVRAREFTWERVARATLDVLTEAAGRQSEMADPVHARWEPGPPPALPLGAPPAGGSGVTIPPVRPAGGRYRPRTPAEMVVGKLLAGPAADVVRFVSEFRGWPAPPAGSRGTAAPGWRSPARRVGMYLAGCVLFSLGVKLFIDAGLGVDPLHSMVIGIVRAVDLPFVRVGLVASLVTAALLAVWSLWNRRLPPLGTFLSMALVGSLVDLWDLAGLERWTTVLLTPAPMMLAGLLLDAYASALIIMGGIGIRVMDLVAIAAARRWGWPFLAGKMGLELGFFAAALALGGPIGPGTVAFLCVVAPFIPSFMWANEKFLRLPNHGLGASSSSRA